MKQQIENIIKKNLPEENEIYPINVEKQDEKWNYLNGFNQALSQINTSLIADEVLKVVITEIEKEDNKWNGNGEHYANVREALNNLLSTLSPNNENKNYGNNI